MNWSAGKIGTINQRSARANGLSIPPIGCGLHLLGLPGGGNKIYDRSPYGNIGTITGATWVRLPSGLWCLSFDGGGAGDDKVNLGSDASLFPDDGTWLIWAKSAFALAANEILFSTDAAGNNEGDAFLSVSVADGKYRFFLYNTGNKNVYSDAPTDTNWHLIGVTFGSGGMKMCVDGVLQASTDPSTMSPKANQDLMLGAYRPAVAMVFDGYLALPRIYNRALSVLEIQNHFNREKHLFGAW